MNTYVYMNKKENMAFNCKLHPRMKLQIDFVIYCASHQFDCF